MHTVDRVRTSIIDVTERRQIKLLKEFSDCENQHGANSSSSNTPSALPVFPGGPLDERVGGKFMSRNFFVMTRYTGWDSYL